MLFYYASKQGEKNPQTTKAGQGLITHGLLNRWTLQYDRGITTGWLERIVNILQFGHHIFIKTLAVGHHWDRVLSTILSRASVVLGLISRLVSLISQSKNAVESL